jgi:hypothetical protein
MLKNLILCWLILVPFSVLAQGNGESTLLKELEKEDQKYKQSQTFQGEPKSQEQIRRDAAENIKLNIVACPPNANASKIEDVRNYIEQQEKLQVKFSASMEKFFKKGINKNTAINEFNAINNESNALIIWGQGKVTDAGVCNRPEITNLISKAAETTKKILLEYRDAVTK